jgi:hypothetical protein
VAVRFQIHVQFERLRDIFFDVGDENLRAIERLKMKSPVGASLENTEPIDFNTQSFFQTLSDDMCYLRDRRLPAYLAAP